MNRGRRKVGKVFPSWRQQRAYNTRTFSFRIFPFQKNYKNKRHLGFWGDLFGLPSTATPLESFHRLTMRTWTSIDEWIYGCKLDKCFSLLPARSQLKQSAGFPRSWCRTRRELEGHNIRSGCLEMDWIPWPTDSWEICAANVKQNINLLQTT